jgi:peptide/nickel transport system substrate-binding protein
VGTALKNKAGNAVHIRCSYQAGSAIHQQTCEIVQSELAALGISVTPTAVADPGGALASGDFDLFDFVWIFAPFPVSNAQAIFDRSGGVDFGGNDDPAMESLLKQASTSTDPDAVRRLVNQADVDLTNDAYELPLYQKPFLIAARANIANIRGNSALGPTYNDQEWGIRSN